MTALRVFRTGKPSMIGAPVLPMHRKDEEFWRIRRERIEGPTNTRSGFFSRLRELVW